MADFFLFLCVCTISGGFWKWRRVSNQEHYWQFIASHKSGNSRESRWKFHFAIFVVTTSTIHPTSCLFSLLFLIIHQQIWVSWRSGSNKNRLNAICRATDDVFRLILCTYPGPVGRELVLFFLFLFIFISENDGEKSRVLFLFGTGILTIFSSISIHKIIFLSACICFCGFLFN